MKFAIFLALLVSFTPAVQADTYCLGQSYSRAYNFSRQYALRCGRDKDLKRYSRKSKEEIISLLATQGIHYVRTLNSTDIYKVGAVDGQEAKTTQMIHRFVAERPWGNETFESIDVFTGRSLISYHPQKGSASDYTFVNEILKELALVQVGIVNEIDPLYNSTRYDASEFLIVKSIK